MSDRPIGRLGLRAEVIKLARHLQRNGCDIVDDRDAGTVQAKDGDTVVFRAIEKGRGGAWICMFSESERIKWQNDDNDQNPGRREGV